MANNKPEETEVEKKVEAQKAIPAAKAAKPEVPISYHKSLKDHPELQEKVARWKSQKRVKCDDKRCHYPLEVVKRVENDRKLEPIEGDDGEKAYRAVCTWDPRHKRQDGKDQFITHNQLFPPLDE
jgi:hypothetical protein